jgi:gluconate kinase
MPTAETPGRLIILSGPVGAGKTAVGEELKELMAGPTVYIEGDTFWKHIVRDSNDEPFNKGLRAAMRAMISAAAAYAASGYETILDFSVPPWYLDGVRKIAEPRVKEVHYVVIRPSYAMCAYRAAIRGEGKFVDYTGLKDLYDSFASVEHHMISDDTSDAATLARQIFEEIGKGKYVLPG